MSKFDIDFDIKQAKNWKPLPRLMCGDGFTISIQANGFAYCLPRKWEGPYTHVECGFPSSEESDLMEYAEDPSDPTGTVYGYVPVEIVKSVLKKHGGVVGFVKEGQTYKFSEPLELLE